MSIRSVFQWAARMDRLGIAITRIGLIVVLVWIGGLKVARYEADGIVPFVANSPLMSFFYADPGSYKEHKNGEGTTRRRALGTFTSKSPTSNGRSTSTIACSALS